MKKELQAIIDVVGELNQRWWQDIYTQEPIERNVGEMIALIHSELSEALEGYRKNKQDDHLPQFDSFTVELADAVIRIFDTASHLAPDFVEAFYAKLEYNQKRLDHTHEHRRTQKGKKF